MPNLILTTSSIFFSLSEAGNQLDWTNQSLRHSRTQVSQVEIIDLAGVLLLLYDRGELVIFLASHSQFEVGHYDNGRHCLCSGAS